MNISDKPNFQNFFQDQIVHPTTVAELKAKVQEYKKRDYRMVHIGCSKIKETFEVIYAFDKDYLYEGIKLTIDAAAVESTEIPSISDIFMCALIYENEIADLFGLKIKGILIDFKGNFYRTPHKAAFSKPTVKNNIEIKHVNNNKSEN
ncbi:MAG: NADH-quinone oxidoreductase subunit C [Oligoflexia bacterium]|nr:NADH-quinone oxidoreductase subunit C [Oligoflexia bacterium]MBF0364363.1 NADH-quinone oxidoreductase subunit C [Oligoflexia bacterium]